MQPLSGKKRPANTDSKHPRQQHRQPAWKLAQELPDFLDPSVSVSASTFGARRLPEIKALWNAASAAATTITTTGTSGTCSTTDDIAITRPSPEEEPLKSSGCKTSFRHLRRRTTSHKGRKRHRYPSSNLEKGDACHVDPDNNHKEPPTTSRKSQRKIISKLRLPHEAWWRQRGDTDEAEAGKKPLPNWLTTHIWHCKRFHMAHIWGWQVPMVHASRGPKAALRLVREGKTLLQDVTWYRAANPIVLQVFLYPNQELVLQSNLQKICPDLVLLFQNKKKSTCETHVSAGSGIVYSMDQFPRQALGPMTWLIQRRLPLVGPLDVKEKLSHDCYFWTHPAIRSAVLNEFHALIATWLSAAATTSSDDGNKVPTLHNSFCSHQSTTSVNPKSNVGMACFKLRGINATCTVQKVLKFDNNVAHKHDNQLLLSDDKLHINLTHGTPVLITVNVGDASETTEDAPFISNGQVLLVVHCEANDPSRNEPSVGWDLYCDAAISRDLFLALVVQGKACPIGVIEEAYTKLDCDPPIADIFPRDYPDTVEGQKYWESTSNEDCKNETTKDATLLRLCLEEGERGGRVDVPTIKARSHLSPSAPKQQKRPRLDGNSLCKLRWHDLVKTNDESVSNAKEDVDGSVVMMRGSFCQPVYIAIAASGKSLAGADVDQGPKRRRRRKAKQFNGICHVTPLNRDEAERHMLSCMVLRQSLSLPAVIACQLKVLGKGTIKPGAEIHSVSEASNCHTIGYVTASSFSASRGCMHGTGVVGASLLLRTVSASISNPQQWHKSIAVLSIEGMRRIELIVNIQNGETIVKATLALLG